MVFMPSTPLGHTTAAHNITKLCLPSPARRSRRSLSQRVLAQEVTGHRGRGPSWGNTKPRQAILSGRARRRNLLLVRRLLIYLGNSTGNPEWPCRTKNCAVCLTAKTRKSSNSQYAVLETRKSDDPSTCKTFYNLNKKHIDQGSFFPERQEIMIDH